jgi:hypothetical protein
MAVQLLNTKGSEHFLANLSSHTVVSRSGNPEITGKLDSALSKLAAKFEPTIGNIQSFGRASAAKPSSPHSPKR